MNGSEKLEILLFRGVKLLPVDYKKKITFDPKIAYEILPKKHLNYVCKIYQILFFFAIK